MNYALVQNGLVIVTIFVPSGKTLEDIVPNGPVEQFIECLPSVNFGWTYDGMNFIAPPVPTLSIVAAKRREVAQLNQIINAGILDRASPYTLHEALAWSVKADNAQKVLDSVAPSYVQTQFENEADKKGVTLTDFCNSVLSNAPQICGLVGDLAGIRSDAATQIDAATTLVEIQNIGKAAQIDIRQTLNSIFIT